MDSLLSFCLSMQVVLGILAPGLPIHGRNVFVSDLWVFVVLVALGFESYRTGWRLERRQGYRMAGVILLFCVAFLHGKFRAHLPEEFIRQWNYEPNEFNPIHEFVMMFRYLSWIVEAAWLWSLLAVMDSPRRSALRHSTRKALSGITFAAGGLTVLSGMNRSFTVFLADIYGYAESFRTWAGRGYGPFRSPLEAGLALSLCGLLIYSSDEIVNEIGRYSRRVVLFVAALGTILSRTMTAVGSVLGAWFLSRFGNLRKRWKILIFCGAAVVGTVVCLGASEFVALKWADLVYRFGPWRVIFNVVASRWDLILFGLGFHPFNVDNAYLFLFFKLGLVGGGVLSYWAIQWGRENWKIWRPSQREVILFLLISGLALDTFIIRPVVMIFIAAGLPLLFPKGKSN